MDQAQTIDTLRAADALLEGHFQLSSGLHSPGYVQCALALQHPRHAEALGAGLAALAREWAPAAVLAPALGGVVIGHEVARALGVRGLFAERVDGVLALRRGFALEARERVLVVEDVVTTGKSTRETIALGRQQGAEIVGAVAIIDRGAAAELDVPFRALLEWALPTYEPSSCPQCDEGLPLVKPGSRPGA